MYNYQLLDEDELEFVAVATIDELPPGERIIFEIDGEPIALFNIGGSCFAIKDVCSHDDGPVAEGDLADFEIACPRHGARFDVRDGKVLSLPAIVDIPSYPVRRNGDDLEIGLPRDL